MLKRSHDDDGLFFLSCNDIARIIKFNGRPFTGIGNISYNFQLRITYIIYIFIFPATGNYAVTFLTYQ